MGTEREVRSIVHSEIFSPNFLTCQVSAMAHSRRLAAGGKHELAPLRQKTYVLQEDKFSERID